MNNERYYKSGALEPRDDADFSFRIPLKLRGDTILIAILFCWHFSSVIPLVIIPIYAVLAPWKITWNRAEGWRISENE